MKVALCFYGLVGSQVDKNGVGQQLDPAVAFRLNKKNVIDPNAADVFIHSWSKNAETELKRLYQPKASIIEEQRTFPESVGLINNVDLSQTISELPKCLFSRGFALETRQKRAQEAFRAYSRWYSTKQVIDLKTKHEASNGFQYDAVILLRLDVAFYSPLHVAGYELDKFYASNWNDYPTLENGFIVNRKNHNQGRGFLDFWFFSDNSKMNAFGKLFDRIDRYHISPHRASFQHAKYCGFNVDYTLYRWEDHEMVRRKEFLASK